jgi:predicted nucleic acid-binding protein
MSAHILDTDVIIDYLRGYSPAVDYIDRLPTQPTTSVVVVAELYAGVRDGVERTKLDELLATTHVIPVSAEIAVEAGLFRRRFAKSHGIGLPDALIAATAVRESAQLVTLNVKHFPMLKDVLLPYQKT